MVIGYVGTAFIVVSIIVVSYFASYDPRDNPFQGTNDIDNVNEKIHFRPNPVDMVVLNWCSRVALSLRRRKWITEPVERAKAANSRLRKPCIKATTDSCYRRYIEQT